MSKLKMSVLVTTATQATVIDALRNYSFRVIYSALTTDHNSIATQTDSSPIMKCRIAAFAFLPFA